MIADQLSSDGRTVVNQILIPDGASPAAFGAVARVAANSAIGWILSGSTWGPPAPAPASPTALRAYAWQRAQGLLAASRAYAVAGVGSISCDAGPSGQSLLAVNAWSLANSAASPAPTQPWTDNDYAVFALTPAEALAFSDAVLAYGQAVYAELAVAAAAIGAGTITSVAQIDALSWPT